MKSIKESGSLVKTRAACINCDSYFVTWSRSRPHGCRAFGFKSAQLPSRVVMDASDEDCLKFRLKPRLEMALR